MPRTVEQHERSLHQPAFCELLPVRDIMHDVIIRTTGAFVAGYELSGINSYYHSDEGRNGTKMALEALIRSLPERSMRMQVRFEITEGLGDLLEDNCGIRTRRCWRWTGPGWNAGDARIGPDSTCVHSCTLTSTGIPWCITSVQATAWPEPLSGSASQQASASSGPGASTRIFCRSSPRFSPAWSRP